MIRDELKEKVKLLGQFPDHRRKINYQSYWLECEYVKGSRDTLKRFDAMKIPKDLRGKSVIDVGCQIGAMCTEAYLRGAREVFGIDEHSNYIWLARMISHFNLHFITYEENKLDLCFGFTKPFDILFFLSMFKHLKNRLFFFLLESLNWKEAYIESNHCSNGYGSEQASEIETGLLKLLMDKKIRSYIRLGLLRDRGVRCLWKVTRD